MPNNIYHKRNANPGVVPTAAQLTVGEIALNTADGKAYTRTTAGTVVELTEASVADGGEQFTPLNVANLAMWLDASDTNTLFQTEGSAAAAVTSPTAISGCVGWWDATDAGSYTTTSGRVSEWRDKTTTGGVFSQATANNMPTLFTSSGDVQTATSSTINGVQAFYFDGVNDLLTGNTVTQDLLRNLAGCTVVAVCRFDSTSASVGPIWFGTPAGSDRFAPVFYGNTNTMSRARRADAESASEAPIGSGATTSPCIMNFALNFANGRHIVRISGGEILNTSGSPALTTGLSSDTRSSSVSIGFRGGFNNYMTGAIGEIIIYNKALTTAESVAIEKYLAAKWGLSSVHTGAAAATAANDPIGTWLDKSGNNRHATQPQAVNRPLRGTINGRAAIAFTGANSHALTTTLADAFGDSIGPYTIFGVANNTLAANDRALIGAITTGNFDIALYYNSLNTNTPVVNFYHVGGFRTHTSPVVAANPAVFSFAIQRHSSTAANTTISLWQNGVRLYTLSSLGTYSLGSLRKFLETIGAARTSAGAVSGAMTGNFCELVVYPQALTEAQIIALSQYANTKWGATFATFPRVSNAEAQDWINRVYTNNGTVSVSTANAVNTFCNAIDAAGIRDRFYRLNLFCGNNLNACLVPLYRGQSLGGTQFGNATDTNNNFLSTDYNERGAVGGLKGNGSSKYLSTGLPMTFLGSNLVHMFASYVGAAEGFTIVIGARSNLAGSLTLEAVYAPTSGSNRARAAIFSPGYQASNNASPLTGRTQLLAQCSDGTNQQHFVRNVDLGAVAGPAGAYSATNTTPFYIFAGDSGTSSSNISSYSPHRIDSYSIGAAFTTATARTAYHDALTTFRDTLQRGQ